LESHSARRRLTPSRRRSNCANRSITTCDLRLPTCGCYPKLLNMEGLPRHQCLIYGGSPAPYLSSLARIIQKKLEANFRCLYFNSPAMVAGIRSYLAATGINVAREVDSGHLVLSSSQDHLLDGSFVVERMLITLEDSATEAISDGYKGLFATGDMTWEFGATKDFSKLLDYEWALEELFRRQPALCGICQYHSDTLPPQAMADALQVHQAIFINETLSRLNPRYGGHRSEPFTHSEAPGPAAL